MERKEYSEMLQESLDHRDAWDWYATWALKQSGVRQVEAETEPDNKKSQRVLEKCGFSPLEIIGEEGPRLPCMRESMELFFPISKRKLRP